MTLEIDLSAALPALFTFLCVSCIDCSTRGTTLGRHSDSCSGAQYDIRPSVSMQHDFARQFSEASSAWKLFRSE